MTVYFEDENVVLSDTGSSHIQCRIKHNNQVAFSHRIAPEHVEEMIRKAKVTSEHLAKHAAEAEQG